MDQPRADVRAQSRQLVRKQGIDAAEAKERVDSLTDAEAIRLASEIEKLPAGGDPFGVILIVGCIVFLVLLFTDIAGYTDIFPFVNFYRETSAGHRKSC